MRRNHSQNLYSIGQRQMKSIVFDFVSFYNLLFLNKRVN